MSTSNDKQLSLQYKDNDHNIRQLSDCELILDKHGKSWLWCESLGINLAMKAETKEVALLMALDSLLFTIQLRDKEIKDLARYKALAVQFADLLGEDD